MHIESGFKLSTGLNIMGGSPHGTKLGNILFCITVEGIEESQGLDMTGPIDAARWPVITMILILRSRCSISTRE